MSKVDLIDHMGDDTTVVNAARVSFDKNIDDDIYKNKKYVVPHEPPIKELSALCQEIVEASMSWKK